MRIVTVTLAVLLVAAAFAPAGLAQEVQQGEQFEGTHVTFEIADRALTKYAVGGDPVAAAIRMESVASVTGGGDAELNLSGVSNLGGGNIQNEQRGEGDVTVMTETGQLVAHDTPRGVFVVQTQGEAQFVQVDLASDVEVTDEGDGAVTVSTSNGTEGTFFVVGQGDVTTSENDSVVARIEDGARMAFRAYPGGKTDGHEQQERLIRNEQAIAEVYFTGSDEDSTVTPVIYATGADATGTQADESGVQVNIDYSDGEGGIVMTNISSEIVAPDVEPVVTLDGEELSAASSYDELESALGSDQSTYIAPDEMSGQAGTDVLVAVNQFSERTIGINSEAQDTATEDATTTEGGGDGGDGGDGGGASNDGGQPGFGATAALLALLATSVAYLRLRR